MSHPNIGLGKYFFFRLLDLSKEDRVAQIFADDGSTWSFPKLFEHSVHVAVGLPEMGLKSGQATLSLVIRNCHELFSIVIGCLIADIRLVPTIAELSAEELASGFKSTKPTHILTTPKTVPRIERAISLSNLDTPPKVLVLTDALYKEIIVKGSHVRPEAYVPVKINDTATHSPLIYFSSGTTGPQKAVALSDLGILRTLFNTKHSAIRHNGPMLNIAQCSWVTWVSSLVRSLFIGRIRVFMNLVDIKRVLNTIQKYKCDTWHGPPRFLLAAEKELDAYPGLWDISSLKLIVVSGDSMKDNVQARLSKKLEAEIYQECGSTEGGWVFSGDVFQPVVLGSVGTPHVPVRLVDPETGEDILEPHKPGEVYQKDAIMIEYVGNTEATAEALRGDWMRTGDLMEFDEDGNYFFVERKKEVFKYNGYQVVPSKLEVLITQIPDVIEAAVVGKRDSSVGDYPTALIVKRPGSKLTAEDIDNFLERSSFDNVEKQATGSLSAARVHHRAMDPKAIGGCLIGGGAGEGKVPDWYKLRGGVIFTDELPKAKNGSGKVAKKMLMEIVNPV